MKITLIYSLFTISFFVLFCSCQREFSLENGQTSAGSLQKGINGNCQPITIGGTYINGQNLGDTNYLEVMVNVTAPGLYLIKTDTVNGYSFKASGSFSDNGTVSVRLTGLGNPVISDTDHFTVTYNTSICQAVVPVGTNAIGPAVFTLTGAPDICMSDTIYGSYVKSISLDTNDIVKISLNVTTSGTYAISTNVVNGYSFSASGTFSATGVQTVNLAASGIPVNIGTDKFTVIAGSSACSFDITVLTAIPVTNSDHFPLTDNSYWTYDDLMNPGDSVRRTVVDTTTIDSNLYKVVREDVKFGGPNQYFFRKTGSNYYEYAAADKYTTSFQYNKQINVDLPFLKENLTTGDSWESVEYTDTATFGQVIILKYIYACTDANATVTLNGKAFTNVYKITQRSMLRSLSGDFGYANGEYLYYYAKGIGLIYLKKTSTGFLQAELQIRNWQVN